MLAAELWQEIMVYLDPTSLVRLMAVSRYFYNLDKPWGRLVRLRFDKPGSDYKHWHLRSGLVINPVYLRADMLSYIHFNPSHWTIEGSVGVLNYVSWLHVWGLFNSVCPGSYVPIYRLYLSESFALKQVALRVSIDRGESFYEPNGIQNTLLTERLIGNDAPTGEFVDLRCDPITLDSYASIICELVDITSGSHKWGLKIESIRLSKLHL
jgi:hypothetical protein